jgi:hypothetical protein
MFFRETFENFRNEYRAHHQALSTLVIGNSQRNAATEQNRWPRVA